MKKALIILIQVLFLNSTYSQNFILSASIGGNWSKINDLNFDTSTSKGNYGFQGGFNAYILSQKKHGIRTGIHYVQLSSSIVTKIQFYSFDAINDFANLNDYLLGDIEEEVKLKSYRLRLPILASLQLTDLIGVYFGPSIDFGIGNSSEFISRFRIEKVIGHITGPIPLTDSNLLSESIELNNLLYNLHLGTTVNLNKVRISVEWSKEFGDLMSTDNNEIFSQGNFNNTFSLNIAYVVLK